MSTTKGVTLEKGKWKAVIHVKGITYNLGFYKNLDDAERIRHTAEQIDSEDFDEWYTNFRIYSKDFTREIKGHERIQYDMPVKSINRLRVLPDKIQIHIANKYYGGVRVWEG